MSGPETSTAADIGVASRPHAIAAPHAEPVAKVLDALGTTVGGLDAGGGSGAPCVARTEPAAQSPAAQRARCGSSRSSTTS